MNTHDQAEILNELKAIKKDRERLLNIAVALINADHEEMGDEKRKAIESMRGILTKEAFEKKIQWVFPRVSP